MSERSNQPQNPPAESEQPEVYSVSQAKDGSFLFSRRGFLSVGAALGGALLARGVCPRFAARSAAGKADQSGMLPLLRVPMHTGPRIASDIVATLRHNDLVRLVSDHSDLAWVQVATQNGLQGWVKRSAVDFSRAIASKSPHFDLDSTPRPSPTETVPQLTCSIRSSETVNEPSEPLAAAPSQFSVQLVRNQSFESGKVEWDEYTTGGIIRTDGIEYSGSWAAWFGGDNAQERLKQLFHVPPFVDDAQQLTFYLYVQTIEPGPEVYDRFNMRFLNAAGNPFPATELTIADNTWPAGWYKWTVDLTGMCGVADQDIQLLFECINNATNNTSFYLDLVSLNVTYGHIYLPLVAKQPSPSPTPTPCGSDCGSYCGSYCSSDYCSSNCPSDCGSYCGWNCPGNCYSICLYDWSW